MTQRMKKVALFDFDRTFYKYDTFSLLQKHVKEDPTFGDQYAQFMNPTILPFIQYKLGLMKGEKVRAIAMQNFLKALDGGTEEEVREFFASIRETIEKDVHPKLEKQLMKHKQEGFHTVLVSGAYVPFLEEVVKRYPFDTIIGTNIPFKNGTVDSSIPLAHLQADRKVDAVLQTFSNEVIDWENSFAYSDRYSDLPMLSLVGHPVAVNAERSLKQYAKKKRWKRMK